MMPKEQVYDLEAILWLLARSRFSFEKFAREVGPKEMDALLGLVVRSPLWQSAVAQGEARARAELLAADRELCLEIVSRHHPALLAKVAPCIEACKDPSRLDAWILAASEQDPEALASMAGLRPAGPGTGRR